MKVTNVRSVGIGNGDCMGDCRLLLKNTLDFNGAKAKKMLCARICGFEKHEVR